MWRKHLVVWVQHDVPEIGIGKVKLVGMGKEGILIPGDPHGLEDLEGLEMNQLLVANVW